MDADALREELAIHQTELAQQNEELLESRAQLEEALAGFTELFELAPIGYAVLDRDGAIRQVNRAGARILGQAVVQLVDKPFAAFVAANALGAFHSAAAAGRDTQLELACKGGPVIARIHVGRVARGTLVAFEDVTLAVRKELAIAHSEAALRESNTRKDEFLAMLSHELRNPLAPITTALAVMQMAPGTEEAVEAQDIVERSVSHLRRLVDDLLDITRISRGKIELRRVPVELTAVVRRTAAGLAPGFRRRGVALTMDVPENAVWTTGDPVRLVQVLTNLLGNAEKFTPTGGRVTVSIETGLGMAVLRVRDTGIGIDPARIGALFEPFAQIPQGLERARGGLGLGLAVARSIVELHGGHIMLHSDGLGRGAEVSFALPTIGAVAAVDAPAVAPAPPRRVLIIEDNHDAARALAAMLALHGHDVHTAASGVAGLSEARAFVPEVVLCDLGLPELDGFGVAQLLRADPVLRAATLVAISGYARPDDVARARAAGFDCHLAKPVSAEDLRPLLATLPRA